VSEELEAAAPPASAELLELAAEAAREDYTRGAAAPGGTGSSSPGAGGPAAGAPVVADPVQEWRSALGLALAAAKVPYPQLAEVYTDAKLDELARAVAAVAVKYNFSAFAFLERWKEELALLMVAGPLVKATGRVIREAKEAKAAKPAAVNDAANEAEIDALRPASSAPAPSSGGGLKPTA
jgi:hypothetical protein